MANPIVDAAIAQMTSTDTVLDSAIVYVNAVPKAIQAAVDAALAGGATAADLKPVSDLVTVMQGKSDALVAAIAANTPSPPPTPLQLQNAKKK